MTADTMNLRSVEAKAFVPAKNFALAKQFYEELGFAVVWSTSDLACLRHGHSSFLLQNFFVQEHADNFMMHLLVENVDDWWQHLRNKRVAERFSVRMEAPEDRPWNMRDFVLFDPSGVLWRIGQPSRHAA